MEAITNERLEFIEEVIRADLERRHEIPEWFGNSDVLAIIKRLRQAEMRLDYMITERCVMQSQNGMNGKAVYALYWPFLGETQKEWLASPLEAIDTAMQTTNHD